MHEDLKFGEKFDLFWISYNEIHNKSNFHWILKQITPNHQISGQQMEVNGGTQQEVQAQVDVHGATDVNGFFLKSTAIAFISSDGGDTWISVDTATADEFASANRIKTSGWKQILISSSY